MKAKKAPGLTYKIDGLTYYDNMITFGSYLAFEGISELRGRDHAVSFHANMVIHPNHTMTPHVNCWDLTSVLHLENTSREPIKNTLMYNMPHAKAYQIMSEIVTEQSRLNTFNEAYYGEKRPSKDAEKLLYLISTTKNNKDPYLVNAMQLMQHSNRFPYYMNTEMVIKNREYTPGLHVQDTEETEFVMEQKTESYDPFRNADWKKIRENVSSNDMPYLEECLKHIKNPLQFMAIHRFAEEAQKIAPLAKQEERHDVHNSGHVWDFFALEKYYVTREGNLYEYFNLQKIAEVYSPSEAYKWMDNFNYGIIKPNLDNVKAHKDVSDLYPNQYEQYAGQLRKYDLSQVIYNFS